MFNKDLKIIMFNNEMPQWSEFLKTALKLKLIQFFLEYTELSSYYVFLNKFLAQHSLNFLNLFSSDD